MIGNQIKKFRKIKKITQEELGGNVGISGVAIMRYEKGQREPNLEMLQKIAVALDVSVYDLIDPNTEKDMMMKEIINIQDSMKKAEIISDYFKMDFDVSKLGVRVQHYVANWRNALNESYKGKHFSNTDIIRNLLINDIARDDARTEVNLSPEQNMSTLFMTSGDKPLDPEILYRVLKEDYVKNFKIERKKELIPVIYEADKMALEGIELPDYLKDAVIEYYEDWFIEKVPQQFRKYLEKTSEKTPEDVKFKEDMRRNRLSFYAGIVDIALKEVSEGRELDELGLQAVKEYYKESSTEDIPEVFRKYFNK